MPVLRGNRLGRRSGRGPTVKLQVFAYIDRSLSSSRQVAVAHPSATREGRNIQIFNSAYLLTSHFHLQELPCALARTGEASQCYRGKILIPLELSEPQCNISGCLTQQKPLSSPLRYLASVSFSRRNLEKQRSTSTVFSTPIPLSNS